MIHNNKIRKNMFKDCLRDMKLPILFEIISTEVLLVVPTMVALLIGELTNYLLDLNIVGIKEKLIPFIIAILLFVFGQPITRLLRNIVIFRQSLVNDRSILRQYLKKYIKSAKAIDEGEVCERLEYDLVQYRFNTINLICRPVIVILYVIQIVLFFMNKVYIPYIIAIAVISIFPVLLSHFFSNLNAKCLKGLREFEEKRKNAEFVFFESHDYIRGNLLTKHFINRYRNIFQRYMNKYGNEEVKLKSAVKVLKNGLNYLAQIGVVIIGACLLSCDKIQPGNIMSGLILLTPFIEWYGYIGEFITEWKERKVIQDRIVYIYEDEEMFYNSENKDLIINSIKTKDVSFQYTKNDRIINLPDINIQSGEKVLITGENGKGKSTLATILAGIYNDYNGNIYVNNLERKKINIKHIRQRISYVEQEPFLMRATIKENIILNQEVDNNKLEKLVKIFNLKLPMDYCIDSDTSNLSGGQKQKISLIRSFYKSSDIVILDEPTNQLEIETKKLLIDYILESEKMVFVVSHDADVKEAFRLNKLQVV